MLPNVITVLLVEDNPGDVALLRQMLSFVSGATFQITCVETLAHALDALTAGRYDVILIDLTLPDSRGIDTFLAIQNQGSNTPMVILTGHDDEALAIQAVRQGAQDYLFKSQTDRDLVIRSIRYAIERKRFQDKLLIYQDQLRRLSSQLTLTGEKERRRIATDLHDNLGQNLAFAKLKLAFLIEGAKPDNKMHDDLTEIRMLVGQAIQYTRSLTFELSSPILYELGFEPAVEALVEQFRQRHQINARFSCAKPVPQIESDLRIVLYQAVKELLINVAKHAHARSVAVSITHEPDRIDICVEDDGKGFDPADVHASAPDQGGYGLFNIRERLDCMGGDCHIESKPGDGARIVLQLPLTSTPITPKTSKRSQP